MAQLEYEITILAILIGLSGFFSGLEVALVGIRKSTVLQLYKQKKRGARALYKLKSNPSRMMASVNLGNNLVNVGSAALATNIALGLFGDQGLGIAIGVMTFLILVFGEITPKTYCNANATKIALRFSGILLVFSYVFYPVVLLLEAITKGMLRIIGSRHHPPGITEDEIKGIVDQGLADRAIEKQERELVHGALDFDETIIRAVMTPRTKMFTLHSKMLLIDALPLINKKGFSRIPLYGDTKDEIVGIVHARDILKHLEKEQKMIKLESIARKPIFASQEKKINDLLSEMKGRRTHMAIVVDEFNGVEGCVTLEDLVEEIVGEIMDEKDKLADPIFRKIDVDTIIADGEIEVEKLNEIFKTHIPIGKDHSSLTGLLHEKLHDIPKVGDKVEVNSLRIIVEEVTKYHPNLVRVERIKK